VSVARGDTIATEYPTTSSNTYDPILSNDLSGLEILLVEELSRHLFRRSNAKS
jgi:hypothetical protein